MAARAFARIDPPALMMREAWGIEVLVESAMACWMSMTKRAVRGMVRVVSLGNEMSTCDCAKYDGVYKRGR